MASDGRSYVTGNFALSLDGFNCGLIQKFEGGDIEGELVPQPGGQVWSNDLEVQMGISMAQPVKDWIDASLAMNYMRKNGELKAADFKRQVRHIREFRDALLTEITFPACDGAAKDAAFLTLKLSPGEVRDLDGDGSMLDAPVAAEEETLNRSDFRFTIEGLETACAKVSKVNALTIKQTTARDKIGATNLEITLPEEHAEPFLRWHEDFVINGNNEEEKHKSGSLEYLNQTRQKELLTLTFSGLGIYKVAAATNNEDKIASVTVEMYCENITAKFA